MAPQSVRLGSELAGKLRWGVERARLERQRSSLAALARSFGFPDWAPISPLDGPVALSPPRHPYPLAGRRGACAATVCTESHLAFARTLASSLRRHEPDLELFVLVLDAEEAARPQLPGATVLSPRDVGLDDPYLLLKLSATDACCAAKPFLVHHLLSHMPFRDLVYLDADQWVFAPLGGVLAGLADADFVVVPHLTSPLPGAERAYERPCLGDIAAGGVLNAGLFATRATTPALDFVARWRELVAGPGAFSPSRGLQHEQHFFNWVIAFVERVHVLRDPAVNVAYWNLHERSLRRAGNDGFTVEGRPLVTFHFSGFSLAEPFRLSRHDTRQSTLLHGPLAELVAAYGRELVVNGALEGERRDYRFGRFPSGIRIDDRLRAIFREHELQLRAPLDPWTPAGEVYYCRRLLSACPGTGSLLPPLVLAVYNERPDLQAAFPNAHLDPLPMLAWFSAEGTREFGYEELFGMHRPVVPDPQSMERLVAERDCRPRAFAGLAAPLGRDRARLVDRLEAAGSAATAAIRTLAFERYAVSPLWLVWQLVKSRDLRAAYPDLLFSDAPALANWLRACATRTELLPPGIADRFERAAEGRALARIYSFLSRQWGLMEQFPLGFVGERREELAATLLHLLECNPEYDLDDVVMYLWLMADEPWVGVPLTLALPVNACAEPSPQLPEGQERLLAPVLGRDRRFRTALERHRNAADRDATQLAVARIRRLGRAPSAFASLADPRLEARNGHGGAHAGGVNFFGFFKSPIGLGYLTRGLAQALTCAGVAVREQLLTNLAMDEDLRPEDFLVPYEQGFGTNLFASYPHLHERLLELQPAHVTRGRRNVVYLAWEQREANPRWREVFAPFDQVWALSHFAAESLAGALQRPVLALPCPLDVTALPPPAAKRAVGLDEGRFTVLYVCDANSSLERKNPEAAIAAFEAAFRPTDRVTLLLRVANAHRAEHGPRMRRLAARAAGCGLDVRLLTGPLSRRGILELISAVDCYLSLHRAEGFGFTCAEAMAYARPTVATGYSGNLDFMNESNSYLVACREVEVAIPEGPFQRGSLWAEPSVEHAAYLLRRVFEQPEEATAVARRGASQVRELLAPARIGRIAAAALAGRAGAGEPASAISPAAELRIAPTVEIGA